MWRPTREWDGQTVAVVGGGPSLKGADLSPLRPGNTIVVNNAYQLCKNASILYFHDRRWWGWHERALAQWKGRIATSSPADFKGSSARFLRLEKTNSMPLPNQPGEVAGWDSGYMAVTLAYVMGAKRIVLLGFDMCFKEGDAHWHEDHPVASKEPNYATRFAPTYRPLYEALKAKGVDLVHGTPGSAMTFIPTLPLAEAIRRG